MRYRTQNLISPKFTVQYKVQFRGIFPVLKLFERTNIKQLTV